MPTSIRGSHQVDGAFKKLMKRFESAQKKINGSAAKRMKMGQYEAATKWMEVGQAFDAFSNKIEAICQEWRDLLASSQKTLEEVEVRRIRPKKDDPPKAKAWKVRLLPKQFYAPALKALVGRGGAASSDEMLGDLHSYVLTKFPESELVVNVPFNFPPWQKTVGRIYKHLQRQGWIERRKDGQWKVTDKGRAAATE